MVEAGTEPTRWGQEINPAALQNRKKHVIMGVTNSNKEFTIDKLGFPYHLQLCGDLKPSFRGVFFMCCYLKGL